MAGVWPIYDNSPKIYKVYAGPMTWGPEIQMDKPPFGSSGTRKIKVSSESSIKSPFKFRIHLFNETIEFNGPNKKDFPYDGNIQNISFSAKSFGTGQIIRCEFY
ncbi:hypothetical protein [Halarcobacter anaerophilus]|jgi:hypothetical protein|uniref:Uncharacterized protein n=1 Tax=Halarcobacter anaerophilus TaxID=877500 RepID=A0A4Q0Y382_9BACT|nr:hypothetical protein [Halarcobacter anaerophilus]QDF29333.1 hypothetical protein AANAER_1860 [Halarcobacter anaerophilus]RXJ64580.1 hypothetical protein CRV06_01085 [Halarcobacter anaerophilus]